jgi:hypothetical protein
MDRRDVVIIGGGLASATTAGHYRRVGGRGSLLLLSADPDPPVHRPPLSKDYLLGEKPLAEVFVHPAEFYAATTRSSSAWTPRSRGSISRGSRYDWGMVRRWALARWSSPLERVPAACRFRGVTWLASTTCAACGVLSGCA